MQLHEVLQAIKSKPKGSFITLLYTRPIKLKKSASNHYGTKTTRCTIRTGISYTNTKAYKKKKAKEYSQLLQTNPTLKQMNDFFDKRLYQPLYWGEWYIPNFIIKHKKNNKWRYYLRCYPSINKSQSTYMLDGKIITKEQLKNSGVCLAEEFKHNDEGCFNLNIEGIQKIY